MSYPPEPWRLRGQMYLSLWRVPGHRLPETLPPGTRPVLLGGYGFAGSAWAVYEPGGDLAYSELLAAVLVRRALRPRVCITHIWVDSEPSREGARELWGIPKELATFDLTAPPGLAAETKEGGGVIARAGFRPRTRLPGVWPLLFTVTQQRHGERKDTPVRCRTKLEPATARWDLDAEGPLAWLRESRQLLNVHLRDFRLRFGG